MKNTKLLRVVYSLAIAAILVPSVGFADNDEKKDGDDDNYGAKVRVEARAKAKLASSDDDSFWGRIFGRYEKAKAKANREVVIAPSISGLVTSSTKARQATIKWSTNVRASGSVWYSTTTPVNINREANIVRSGKVLNHKVKIKKLEPNTKYYAVVSSKNSAGVVMSAETSFTTAAL